MANNNWNNYTEKNAALTDKDEIMLRDSTDGKNKRSPLSKIWNYMVDKMATAVISKLETDNKTIIGAINYLYGNKISNNRFAVQHIRYEDSEVIELGGLDACMRDALNNTVQKDGAFYGTFTATIQYLMLGYRYANGTYGVIILFGYNNSTERWNINNGEITKV